MLIGHAAQINFLKKSLAAERIAHAYLFVGPEGVGRRKVAAEFVSLLLKKELSAEKLEESPEVMYIDRGHNPKTGKKNKDISIERVRGIRDYINHHSFLSEYKIVIINEADYLNKSSSNALLKTLEEPSPKSVIILLTVDEKSLPATVVSRCQVVRFYQVATKEIYEMLVKDGVNRDTALEVARLSNHVPGAAIRLAKDEEQIKFYKEEVKRFLNLNKGGLQERFKQLEPFFSKREDHIETREKLAKVLRIWLGLWRDMIFCQNQTEELVANVEAVEQLRLMAQKTSSGKMAEVVAHITESLRMLGQNVHPRLMIENLVLSWY